MSSRDPDTDSVEASSQEAAILDESDPRTVIERLPNTVFPVMIRFSLAKSTSGDRTHESLSTPDYPVDVRIPQGEYIPESTVYFDNPAERPPRNTTAWRPYEFIDSLSELLDEIDDSPHVDSDRIQFTDLCVAEIASHYTTSDPDTGDTVATPELYRDQGDITLGYFRREGSLSATKVRDSLDTAMPGETRSPPQLIQITEATAKPARSSRETQQPAGRHKYYTEGEAERVDRLDATPANWMLDRVAPASGSHRPLDPVLSEIDRFFPRLNETDLLEFVQLRGRTETSERFYANEVLSR
jgi:hypothetical protein